MFFFTEYENYGNENQQQILLKKIQMIQRWFL